MHGAEKPVTTPIAEAVAGAREKLCEAGFFLRLMDRSELTQRPLIDGNEVVKEFTFHLSALLSACYSVAAYLKESEPRARSLAVAFLNEHAVYYARGKGLRTLVVHFRPVEPGHHGYIPPPGFQVILRFREPQQPVQGSQVGFDVATTGRYYYGNNGPQNAIGDLCAVHLSALRRLIDDCEKACT